MKRIFLALILIPLLASGGQSVNTGGRRKLFTPSGPPATACGSSVTGVLADYWARSNSSSPLSAWSDSSVNVNNLTATGSPTWANNTFGAGLAGVGFSGSGQYFSASTATIPASSFGNLSFYAVVNFAATNVALTSNHGGNKSYVIQLNSSNKLELDNQNTAALCTSTSTLSTGTVYEIAFIANGSSCSLYVNGTSVNTSSYSSVPNAGVDRFGTNWGGTPTNSFNGSIYEAIFSSSTSYQSGAHTCWTALGLP